MSDGTPTLESPAPEPVNLEVPELQTPAEAEAHLEPEVPVLDLEEIEFDGEKYSVPKKLKDGFMMQADYTRKTQGLADQRKALEAAHEVAKQERESGQAHLREVARVYALNDQLAEFDKIDWNKLQNEDPFRAQALFQSRTLLKDQRDGLVAQIQTNEQERLQKAQQDFAKRYADTNSELADPVKGIKGWNDELARNLADFARANGMTEADIRQAAVSTSMVKLLHKAFLGEQLINAKTTAAKAAEPRVEIKPTAKVSGAGATATTNLADADMETYVALRKKQGYGKR